MGMTRSIKSRARSLADPRVAGAVVRQMPSIAGALQRSALYWPPRDADQSHSRPLPGTGAPFPVPPPELRADYGTDADGYLASGAEDVAQMRKLLADSGAPAEDAKRILDLGCATGRMIRHLEDLTPQVQVWGCDIWADAIEWCHGHLSPPFYFATTTVAPHLPFADRSFGLVYCGSLFTHIDDLAEAWFCELHRIIRPGGRLVFSVNDRHSAGVVAGHGDPAEAARYAERAGGRANWNAFAGLLASGAGFRRFTAGQAWMASAESGGMAHVLWDPELLCRRLAWGWRCCSITPEAYGHQTLIVLERLEG